MDDIVESIYKSCDEENINAVLVSSLINFIKPFMPNDLHKLEFLRTQLDPTNVNPKVNFAHFKQKMTEWIASIESSDFNTSLSESLANSGYSNNLVDANSVCNNNEINNQQSDEEIASLKFQLNKAITEIDLLKQQLAACEEQNELLQSDLEVCNKKKSNRVSTLTRSPNVQCDQLDSDESYNQLILKCKNLKQLLIKYEKSENNYISQIEKMEIEVSTLKEKLIKAEKCDQESRKSIIELHDSLDVKETEILTLMEIIENLKSELIKNSELTDFYHKEQEFLRQKTKDLEQMLQRRSHFDNTPKGIYENENGFNTPRLLRQLSNPVSPFLKGSSSPLNCSLDSQNCSFGDIFATTNDACAAAVRHPLKSLKEELSQIPESVNLQKIVKNQEDIKNHLWQNMKQLSVENEALTDYKRECTELALVVQEKNDLFSFIQNKMMLLFERNTIVERKTIAELNSALDKLESNLRKQQLIDVGSRESLKKISHNNLVFCKSQTSKILSKIGQACDGHVLEQKRQNKSLTFIKQQMKIDKLLEKQEIIESSLIKEREINSQLRQKCQESCRENSRLLEELELSKSREQERESFIVKLTTENNDLLEKIEMLQIEYHKIENLESNISKLLIERESSERQICELSNKFAVEYNINASLLMENKILINKSLELEKLLKKNENCQILLKQELHSLRVSHRQFEEKNSEILNLKDEIKLLHISRNYITCLNDKLCRAILKVQNEFILLDEDWIEMLSNLEDTVNQEHVPVKNDLEIFERNMELVITFLEKLCDTALNLTVPDLSEEKNFICETEFWSSQDMLDVEAEAFFQLQEEGFKVNSKELEEKFAMLALLFTIDNANLKTRRTNEDEKFKELIVAYSTHLNRCLCLLNNLNKKSKIYQFLCSDLQPLKELSLNAIRSAYRRGMICHETRLFNCWRSVVNYVAFLNQEIKNKQNETEQKRIHNVSAASDFIFSLNGLADRKHFKYCYYGVKFFTFSLVLLMLTFVFFIFYINHLCEKKGLQMCPLQWLMNVLLRKTYNANSF